MRNLSYFLYHGTTRVRSFFDGVYKQYQKNRKTCKYNGGKQCCEKDFPEQAGQGAGQFAVVFPEHVDHKHIGGDPDGRDGQKISDIRGNLIFHKIKNNSGQADGKAHDDD